VCGDWLLCGWSNQNRDEKALGSPQKQKHISKIVWTYLMGHQVMVSILVCLSSSWQSGLHT
jgi:hypothetical protein